MTVPDDSLDRASALSLLLSWGADEMRFLRCIVIAGGADARIRPLRHGPGM